MVSSNMPRKTKIFVGRLPENCRNDELRQLFLRYGEVTECDVMNRYGFVHMAREEDAAAAIKALHNTNFKGATINVEQSTGKSRGGGPGGRRDDRRGGPMRGGRGGGGGGGGRDGGRDGGRPGPYNDRRGNLKPLKPFSSGVGGYSDYGNRGGGGYGDRGGDYGGPGGGYGDRGGYGQNVGGGAMGGYSSSAPGMGGGYGPAAGGVGGYGPSGGGMGGDFNRGVPGVADYGRADNFGTGRSSDPYSQRNDYDRSAAGPMRNGGGGGAVSAGGYGSGYTDVGQYGRPMGGGPSYNAGAPSYNSGPGPQTDMFSRRPGNAVASGGYPPVGGGYSEAYDRPDAYGPPRGGGRFPGPADAMPPRY